MMKHWQVVAMILDEAKVQDLAGERTPFHEAHLTHQATAEAFREFAAKVAALDPTPYSEQILAGRPSTD